MSTVDLGRPGVWRELFRPAMDLMRHFETAAPGVPWTFGGGTVLMLRIGHRMSKDIDLFVPDGQFLGLFNPRLSDQAARVSADYDEAAEYIKLYLPHGEIDVVAGGPLTDASFEAVDFEGLSLRVETCAEVIAKKFWHRGHRAKARDLFDLCAVADADPGAIERARPWMGKHADAFLRGLETRRELARREFEAIDRLAGPTDFDACMERARRILLP